MKLFGRGGMDKLSTAKLNILTLACFFFVLFFTGIIRDFVNVVIMDKDISFISMLTYRLIHLICGTLCFWIVKYKKIHFHARLYSLCVLFASMAVIAFSPAGEVNGTIVYVFGVMLFIDSFDLWRVKIALGCIGVFSLVMLVGFAEFKGFESGEVVNSMLLNMYIAVTFYSNFYRDKVRYFENGKK
jgi:hypothetical protein